MAKVKIEEVIDHLESEFRDALKATLREHFPDEDFNPRTVFKTFKKQVYQKCNDWERIPNKFIRSE